jgi:Ca2+:H+ antiporter
MRCAYCVCELAACLLLLACAGCCFLFGGARYKVQNFNAVANQATSSLLFLSCISIVLPTAAMQLSLADEVSQSELLGISRWTAIIMLLV